MIISKCKIIKQPISMSIIIIIIKCELNKHYGEKFNIFYIDRIVLQKKSYISEPSSDGDEFPDDTVVLVVNNLTTVSPPHS